jgi:hypothetical protein
MRRPARTVPAAIAIATLLAGCGGPVDDADLDAGGSEVEEPGVEEPDEAQEPEGTDPSAEDALDPVVGDAVEAAILDAADREGVDTSEVFVRPPEVVTWPDGSLGCPQPDEMYTQALVDGYRIVLVVDGRELVYHGQLDQEPFLCEDPQPPVS